MYSIASCLAVSFLVLAGRLSAQREVPVVAEALAARRAALHDAGLSAPLQLHPVRLLGRGSAQVAEALGLVLEQRGMPGLALAEGGFTAAEGATWEAIPVQFGAHVKKVVGESKVAGWHLYAEFLGTPRTGPDEVRFVVVDHTGELVWSDRQTRTDADFRRTAAKDPDPLGCATLVGDRLFRLAGWKAAPGTVREGAFGARWRQRSGLPDPKELAAMRQRTTRLRDGLDAARLVVLPTLVQGGHDEASSARLATQLQQDVGGKVVAGATANRLTVAPSANEQKRLWDLARGLGAALAKQPIDGDYAVVVDLGLDPDGGHGFVHVVVCTAKGEVVLADFANDQNPLFQRIQPETTADAERVAVAMLAQLLR